MSIDSFAVEMIPSNLSFTGTPNLIAYDNNLLVSDLDTSLTYKCRVLSYCGYFQTHNWSDAFTVRLLSSCNDMFVLSCQDTLVLHGGPGVYNFRPCGGNSPGKEFFFNVIPEFSGNVRLKLIPPHTGSDISFSTISACDQPGGVINCIPGSQGIYNLGYLQEGQPYLIFADQLNTQSTTFKLTLLCTIDNDEANLVFYGLNPDPTFVILINDTCRLFGNRFATNINVFPHFPDPDPSIPPGNWYDSPDHSVWFAFYAPQSGTVRINVSTYNSSTPLDPQVALLEFGDTLVYGFKILATGEDNDGLNPADAELSYTGLTPGKLYLFWLMALLAQVEPSVLPYAMNQKFGWD